MRYCPLTRMPERKKKKKKTDKDSHEIHNNTVMLETVWQLFVKLNIHLPHNLAHAFLDITQVE